MNITKYNDLGSDKSLLKDKCHKDREYALFAIGDGAINSVKKAFDNNILRDSINFFKCNNERSGQGNDSSSHQRNAEICQLVDDALKSCSFKKAIIISTLGGYTGTEYAPIFSKFLSDIGIELTNIVTLPFSFEGKSRFEKS